MRLSRVNGIKNKVLETAKTIKGFDQKKDVDKAPEQDKVSITSQDAPVSTGQIMTAVLANPLAAIPEKVSGEASFKGDDVQSMDASKKAALSKPQEFRYEKLEDGTTVYSGKDDFGYLTVREQKDGTLFIAASKEPAKDFASLSAPEFTPPEDTSHSVAGDSPKSGISRYIPSSVGSVNLSEAADNATEAVSEGTKKLGDWLSDITKSVSSASQAKADPRKPAEAEPKGTSQADPRTPAPITRPMVEPVGSHPILAEPTPIVPEGLFRPADPVPAEATQKPVPQEAAEAAPPTAKAVETEQPAGPTEAELKRAELKEAAKNGDVGGIIAGGFSDLADVGKNIFKMFGGK